MHLDVLIVGAGAAGIAAFEMLDRAGLNVILLEARDRVGGRIHTIHDPLSALPLELGAEFVHGRPPEIWDLIRDAGLPVYEGTDASRYMNKGEVEHNAKAWELVNSVIEDMQESAKSADRSFEDFLNNSTYDAETKRSARGYIEGFNAAKASEISIQALSEEQAAADQIDGDSVFRFSLGYDAVPLHLLRRVSQFRDKLRLNTVVERVDWKPNSVVVSGRNALTGDLRDWNARFGVITAPLGVLQAGSIAFSPEPSEILDAARSLRFGQVYRVVLRFREPFWESKLELRDAGFILSREELFPTWWTTLATRSNLLTGWSAGAHADSLIGRSREQVLEAALASLSRIAGFSDEVVRGHLEAMYFHDWQADPFARGAYSYVPSGALAARKRLSQPIESTLFFAGEATEQHGHSATVHGAIASGRRAAQQILSVAAMTANR